MTDSFSYYVSGKRAYFYGRLGGNSEGMGWHLKGRMGGFWLENQRLFSSYNLSLRGNIIEPMDFRNAVAERLVEYPGVTFRIIAHPEDPVIAMKVEGQGDLSLSLKMENDRVWLEPVSVGSEIFQLCKQRSGTLLQRTVDGTPSYVNTTGDMHISNRQYLEITSEKGFEVVLSKNRPCYQTYDALLSIRKEFNSRFLPTHDDSLGFWAHLNALELFFERDCGAGFAAGIGEFPWWFGIDGVYTCLGLLETPLLDYVGRTIDTLASFGNGLAPHEVTTAGKVCGKDRTNEIIALAYLALSYSKKTGKREYLELVDVALNHLSRNQLRKAYPVGLGITEVPMSEKCSVLDAACWLYSLLRELKSSSLVQELKNAQLATTLLETYERSFINDWMGNDGLFYDILTRKKGSFEGHFIQIYPLAMGLVEKEQGSRLLNSIELHGYFEEDGMIHSLPLKTFASEDYGPGNKNTIIWSLPTVLAIEAGLRYGRRDLSERFIASLDTALRKDMYGAIPEILPDDGCIAQAWNAYVIPLLERMNE